MYGYYKESNILSFTSRIGRKTVGPVSCRVGVGDVNFPRTRLLCGGCPPLGWDGWKRLVRRIWIYSYRYLRRISIYIYINSLMVGKVCVVQKPRAPHFKIHFAERVGSVHCPLFIVSHAFGIFLSLIKRYCFLDLSRPRTFPVSLDCFTQNSLHSRL